MFSQYPYIRIMSGTSEVTEESISGGDCVRLFKKAFNEFQATTINISAHTEAPMSLILERYSEGVRTIIIKY
jgi:hypothetical protein